MLSEELVERFQELYQKRYGKDISKEEATLQGSALLEMMKVIYRPLEREQK